MNKQCWMASAVLLIMTAGAEAEDGATPDFQLSAADRAQINLGQAGLLRSYFESDQFGTVQWRTGQGRITIGAAEALGRSHSDYKDGTTDAVIPLNFIFGLPSGDSAIRLGLKGTFANGGDNLVELDGTTSRIDLQYLQFPNADLMWGIGGFYEYTDMDIEGSGTVKRPAGGVRGDLLYEFDENWGVAARAEYSWGENDVEIGVGPGVTMRHKQGDNYLYTQAELIGQFRSADIGFIPEGWVAHPILGAQFRRSFIEATANNFGVVSSGVVGSTENYGTAWAHLRLEKEVPPGGWSPNFLVGFEREYVNDLDSIVSEPNYAVVGAGLSTMFGGGTRFEVSYTRHQGLEGIRSNQGIVGTLTMEF